MFEAVKIIIKSPPYDDLNHKFLLPRTNHRHILHIDVHVGWVHFRIELLSKIINVFLILFLIPFGKCIAQYDPPDVVLGLVLFDT